MPVKGPVGWLIGLALPQRQRCGDVRCDDRVLLDSGQDCSRCAEKQDDRRDQRRAVAARRRRGDAACLRGRAPRGGLTPHETLLFTA
ncbi:hypothetical protein ACFVT5_41960 [Streptomyces sp. NPDC058001]|uniref:hypothetical protein n=1 Tax=Streptomyces sp. NPDC058001 TaxID=3346300 RepID=UPI0036E21F3A